MQMNTIQVNIDKYESMLKELGVLKTENEELKKRLIDLRPLCAEENFDNLQQANTAIALSRVKFVLEMESGLGQEKVESIMWSMVSVAHSEEIKCKREKFMSKAAG